MKIKINQEAQTSNLLDALLKLERQQPMIKTRWIIVPIVLLLLMYSWRQQVFSAWVILPFLWVIIVLNLALIARSKRVKLQKIELFKFDPIFWRKFRFYYPELGLKQRQLIEAGFKDYLALHVMQKQAYAMPSHAVDSLWHVMLEFPKQYQQLCEQVLGRQLHHDPYDATTTSKQQTQQLFEAWRMSCTLHAYQPRNTTLLPRLFAIDQALHWQEGQYFNLELMTKDYAQYLQAQSSSSSSSCGSSSGNSCSSCSSCGGGGGD
ncbi:hypothetical protein F909_03441 [Acinetobacter sp. ANC 3929]|uniref:hypothetical protein n=1 Tax=unclassified Acinetobacter TaxID=196816 RepID=UPI0002CD733D|nr:MULTISPECIES: hypothetical protein [unclassified Acinetobacter]ENW79114.1 hypothetical protein F909_03441 [Acinetobacter sp. ANC 3929]MCH7351019.1 hypothetical protein [Acinetobacter sp. NIPH 2023]MCH7354977.1 hypothetical protein [Acinetobacter sp. NIPH 1958]MCH7358608.1 hypothetical protein [Acinetobacter sp. NIPH 2024]